MEVARDVRSVREAIGSFSAQLWGFVPTMGAPQSRYFFLEHKMRKRVNGSY
ncbi:MAG: hypothetical protein ACTJLL_00445 [Anaplasma sp.]